MLALAVPVAVTGAFHEDGLADTFDALGGVRAARACARDHEGLAHRHLRRRRARTRPVAALAALAGRAAGRSIAGLVVALVLGHTLSRIAPVVLLRVLAYAGDAAHAKAKPLAQRAATGDVVVALVVGGVVVAVVAGIGRLREHRAVRSVAHALGIVLAMVVLAAGASSSVGSVASPATPWAPRSRSRSGGLRGARDGRHDLGGPGGGGVTMRSTCAIVAWRHAAARGAAGRCIGRTDLLSTRAAPSASRISSARRRAARGCPGWCTPRRCERRRQGRWLRRWGWRHVVDDALSELDFGAWDGGAGTTWREEIDAWCAAVPARRPAVGSPRPRCWTGQRAGVRPVPRIRSPSWSAMQAGCLRVGGDRCMATRPPDAADWPAAPRHGELRRLAAQRLPPHAPAPAPRYQSAFSDMENLCRLDLSGPRRTNKVAAP